MDGISIAMPINRVHPGLGRAVSCILNQQLDDHIELILVANGGESAPREIASSLAATDPRIRVLETDRESLAPALNLALREARYDLVARLDDDDECPPLRLARQARFLRSSPGLAGVGCAWEFVEPCGRATVQRPPTDARALRSRLLLGNCLAHGSMMLRRDLVLASGGYDESLDRAQDYDLWLRLAADLRLACLPEVLYRYHAPGPEACSNREQALAAARAMLRAWRELPPGDDDTLAHSIADALGAESPADSARDDLRSALDAAPSSLGLLAHLWIEWLHPPLSREAIDACRRARLREVGAKLRDRSVRGLWLWGAGNHAAWILDHQSDLGLPIRGIIDDARPAKALAGSIIGSPEDLAPGDTVLIASDAFELAIWERSAPLRARGVDVVRLYGDEIPMRAVAS